ncbi:MAG: hypothetical protein ACRCUY_05305 [Thermoguttaceae bacterium]
MIHIGTDEAGYGPNLGPLIISATAWNGDAERLSVLSQKLRDVGLPFADSKTLYHSGGSLSELEQGIHAALYLLGSEPTNFGELLQYISGDTSLNSLSVTHADSLERRFDDVEIPYSVPRNIICEKAKLLQKCLSESDVHLLALKSRIIYPAEFNHLIDMTNSKGTLLSESTVQLIQNMMKQITEMAENQINLSLSKRQEVVIWCDKHGGRNKYANLLYQFFPDNLVQVIRESRAESVYRLSNFGVSDEWHFEAKGESHLPIALASMLSKYIRELSMLQFNRFWQTHLPNLRETAGYPEDAKRFRCDIVETQKKLGISDSILWRNR